MVNFLYILFCHALGQGMWIFSILISMLRWEVDFGIIVPQAIVNIVFGLSDASASVPFLSFLLGKSNFPAACVVVVYALHHKYSQILSVRGYDHQGGIFMTIHHT